MADFRENAIEWLNGQETVTATFSQKRMINRVMKMAEESPEEIQVQHINKDNSIVVQLPLRYIRIQKPRTYTPEEKEIARARFLERLGKTDISPEELEDMEELLGETDRYGS